MPQQDHQFLRTNPTSFTMQLFLVAAALIAVAAAGTTYPGGYKAPEITIVRSNDERRADGSSDWGYAGSDGTTRDESNVQKKLAGYGKAEGYGESYDSGNANKGSSYYISPEGQKITLTWTADENGFQPKGDHLPVAPEPVQLPYQRTGN